MCLCAYVPVWPDPITSLKCPQVLSGRVPLFEPSAHMCLCAYVPMWPNPIKAKWPDPYPPPPACPFVYPASPSLQMRGHMGVLFSPGSQRDPGFFSLFMKGLTFLDSGPATFGNEEIDVVGGFLP